MKLLIKEGTNWALTGSDSELKSRLCEYLAGIGVKPNAIKLEIENEYSESAQIVSFAQQRAAAGKDGFMQARYHSIISDFGDAETVKDVLSFNNVFDVNPFEIGRPLRKERKIYKESFPRIIRLLNLTSMLKRDFVALSNGETRRVLLARALLANPKLLVLNDPCAGLDPVRREQIKKICDALATRGVILVIAVRNKDEIPDCVTNVMDISGGCLTSARRRKVSRTKKENNQKPLTSQNLANVGIHESSSNAREIIAIRNLKISFGKRKLFDNFSWIVRQGERWAVRGANGSGKTTLLSLINADNPIAYANDVTVFGHKRGEPGIEISKIRKRIAMVSPELQAYTGKSAIELMDEALKRKPDLLLLDEPCLNLDDKDVKELCLKVSRWLKEHPRCTAICVIHRAEHLPTGFTYELKLG